MADKTIEVAKYHKGNGDISTEAVDGDVHCVIFHIRGKKGRLVPVHIYRTDDSITLNSDEPIKILPSATNAVTVEINPTL